MIKILKARKIMSEHGRQAQMKRERESAPYAEKYITKLLIASFKNVFMLMRDKDKKLMGKRENLSTAYAGRRDQHSNQKCN